MAFTGGRGREFWEKTVREFERSDGAQEAFARSLGVSSAALQHWRLKLQRERGGTRQDASSVRLLPVTVTSSSTPEMVEVGVDGMVLWFRARTDAGYVAQLLGRCAGDGDAAADLTRRGSLKRLQLRQFREPKRGDVPRAEPPGVARGERDHLGSSLPRGRSARQAWRGSPVRSDRGADCEGGGGARRLGSTALRRSLAARGSRDAGRALREGRAGHH